MDRGTADRRCGRPEPRRARPGLPEMSGSPGWVATTVPTGRRGIGVRVYRRGERRSGWLVWAHGGSWRGGSVEGWHEACADLATLAACTVVSVDYRLAPAHPHPAALQDVLAVLEWARHHATAEGQGDALAVGGDSAGATIAACAALALRDQGRQLAAQLLAYPPLDPGCRSASYFQRPQEFPPRDQLLLDWHAYQGSGDPHRDATTLLSTPLNAADVTGAAPAIMAVGTLDPVLDDVRDYADRLTTAGVPVRFRAFAGMRHGAFLHPYGQVGAATSPLRGWLGGSLRALLDTRMAPPAGRRPDPKTPTERIIP